MANKEQLAILKQGVKIWNDWREKNSTVSIDLSEAHLSGAQLSEARLSGAHLCAAHLDGAHLDGAHLIGADLRGADLSLANLSLADLIRACLSRANLRGANLSTSNLCGADLSSADLRGADLTWANLSGANLSGADWSGGLLGDTTCGDIDLSTVQGLESVQHQAPSSVGIDTIYKSKGNIPEVFLRGCGVPENFITFMRSLTGKAFDFYSCFVSHSAKDKPFVERLHNDLQAKGVRTWYFPEDAKWGETVWGEIDRGIKIYDKLVVVCSQNSLQSEPVIREIDRSLQREAREHKNILFPITLDLYIFDTWEHELKADLLRKVIGDFCGWDSAEAFYRQAFERLLKNLQAG